MSTTIAADRRAARAEDVDKLAGWLFRFQGEAQMCDPDEVEKRWKATPEKSKDWYRERAWRLIDSPLQLLGATP
jgi:hypothetical protein